MSQEKLTQQKEKMGQLTIKDKLIVCLILVVVYSFLTFLYFRAKRTDLSPDKPKILTIE